MKNILILVALLIAAGSAAVVGLSGSDEEDGVTQRRPAGNARHVRARTASPRAGGSAPKKMNFSGGGGGGGASLAPVRELVLLLEHYKRTINAARVKQIANAIRLQMVRYQRPYSNILGTYTHELLPEAIELAGEIKAVKLLEPLALLAKAGPMHLRARAILAADATKPWNEDELTEFLTETRDDVVLAALECTQRHKTGTGYPTPALIGLLGHSNKVIREGALSAMPPKLTPLDRDLLLANINHGTDLMAENSMRALARTRISDPKVEAVLLERLESPRRATRLLALDLLSTKKGGLSHPADVWSPRRMHTVDDNEHARELYCLERTKSYDPVVIKSNIVVMAPLPRYFAARCLVTDGDKQGIVVLLDMLDELQQLELRHEEEVAAAKESREKAKSELGLLNKEEADAAEEEASLDSFPESVLLRAVRRLLGKLSRTGEYATAEKWHEWFDNLGRFAPRKLGPPPFELR